jgi:hypothetical protein
MADRLALATRPLTARRKSSCAVCTVPIVTGASMVRLVNPHGWCHERCVSLVSHQGGEVGCAVMADRSACRGDSLAR